MAEQNQQPRELTLEEKRIYNSGYIKGVRDAIKMFTDLGVSLSADVLSLERQLAGELQNAPAEPVEGEEKAPEEVEEAPVEE